MHRAARATAAAVFPALFALPSDSFALLDEGEVDRDSAMAAARYFSTCAIQAAGVAVAGCMQSLNGGVPMLRQTRLGDMKEQWTLHEMLGGPHPLWQLQGPENRHEAALRAAKEPERKERDISLCSRPCHDGQGATGGLLSASSAASPCKRALSNTREDSIRDTRDVQQQQLHQQLQQQQLRQGGTMGTGESPQENELSSCSRRRLN